jgi:hypothetical protein
MSYPVQADFRKSMVPQIFHEREYQPPASLDQDRLLTDRNHFSAGDLPAEKVSAPAVQGYFIQHLL